MLYDVFAKVVDIMQHRLEKLIQCNYFCKAVSLSNKHIVMFGFCCLVLKIIWSIPVMLSNNQNDDYPAMQAVQAW